MPLPALGAKLSGQPLRLPPGELWCASCGFDVPAPKFYEDEPDGVCPSCKQRTLVPAVQVLRPGEFFVQQ